MANDGFIEFLSPNALAELKQAQALVDSLALKIEQISKFKAPSTPSGVNSASKQIIDDLKAQEQAIKQTTNALIQEEKVKQQVLATEIKQSNAIKANVAQREAQRKAALAQQQADEKAAKAAERNALANERLNDAYGKLNAQRNQAARTLQNLIASETASNAEIRKAQREFDTLNNKVKKADQAVGNFSKNVGNYKNALSGVTQLMSAFGIATGLALGANLVKDIYQTTKELQSLDLALKMVSETQNRYATNTSFVRELSERWGIEIKGLTEQFTQFYVNAKGKLSEDAIRKSFEGIAKAGAVMGISIDKQNDAFYAFNQMLSKGTVQAEELKKQLGNALPGAIKAATMAYQELNPNLKVTEQMMLDQMKAGKLVSTEMVPAIIRAYEKLYGIENVNGVDTLAASTNRLSNSWTELIRSLNDSETGGVSKFFSFMITSLTDILKLTKEINNANDPKSQKIFDAGVIDGQANALKILNEQKQAGIASDKQIQQDAEGRRKYAQEQVEDIQWEINALEQKAKLEKKIRDEEKTTSLGAGLGFRGTKKGIQAALDLEETNKQILALSRSYGFYTGVIKGVDEFQGKLNDTIKKGAVDSDDGKAKKAKKDKIALNFKEIESEYNLKIAILERKKAENVDDDQTSYEERIAKRIAFSEASIEIIDMQLQKEAALIKFKRDEDYAKNDLALKNKEISLKQHSINQTDIINTYINKNLTAEIKASDDIKALQKQDFNFFKAIKYKQQDEVLKLNKIITNGEIAKYKIIADNEKNTLVVREAAFQAYIQLEKDLLKAQKLSDIQRAESRGASKEEISAIIAEYKNAIAALENIKSPKILAIEQVTAEMKELTSSFAGNAGLGAAFKLLQEGLDIYGDNVLAKTTVIAEAFQEMYNFINKISQENFDAEKQRLEEQKNIALAFAGDSDTAKAEIERQAEVRRKEIAAREFKAKKQQAIFNIAIDTAQAIIAAVAQSPLTFGLPFSAIAAAIGAAQIAMVNSQQIPAFKDGGVHDGGLMLVNDAKGSNFKETIKTPDGKLYQPKERNVLMNAPKGTEIFTPDQWQKNLDSMLMGNNISYAQPNITLTADFDKVGSKIVNAINNKQEYHQTFDRSGIKNYISNGHTQKEILNNQVTFGR
jgi:tape measure domain-containing protein